MDFHVKMSGKKWIEDKWIEIHVKIELKERDKQKR